jgi:hypothetical protein
MFRTILTAAALTAAILVAAPAHASTGEDTTGYLAALARDGIPYAPSAIPTGESVCTLLRDGVSESSVANYMASAIPDVPQWFVRTVTADAHTYLCPDATSSFQR